MKSNKVIVALDFNNSDQALYLANRLDPLQCNLKVGSQLFTSLGPDIIYELRKLGFNIFLDLKFHDIPNTVLSAVEAAIDMEIWMLNVHASGGLEMMKSASQATLNSDSKKRPIIIAVTMLTSLNQEIASQLGVHDINSQTLKLAKLAKESSLDGVVCSPQEISNIKEELGKDFIVVTPGIRLTKSITDDQKRIASPKEAISLGADFIVIGRPITQSKDPYQSLQDVINQI